jgi:O-antigen ligase
LGLFRGSLGIIGLLAVCAYLAGEKDRGWKHLLSLTGALCGCTVILLSGSKTSLIAVALVLSLRTLMARSSNAWRMAAILIAVILSLSGNVGVSRYLSPTLVNFFESQGQKRETLDSRMDVWRACERAVRANPIIALGAPLRRVMPVLPAAYASQGPYLAGVYHSEYLSIFMLGGIWNLTIYGLGLWLLGKEFMAGGFARPQKRFATLVFLGGLLESTTCAHLGPGLFYVCTAPLFATVYGLGARDDCLRVHWPRVIIRLGNHVGISYRSHHVQKSQGRTQGRSRLGSPSDHER